MNKYRVAALIINWNGAADTLHLLDSLRCCISSSVQIEAFVIDNKSQAQDRAELEAGIDRYSGLCIHYRRNEKNVGVPAAYNQAIQIAGLEFDYYLRLDNDVVLEADALLSMICAHKANLDRGVGLIGADVRLYQPPHYPNGGAVSIDLVRGRTRVSYPRSDTICDGVLGCVMLISGDVVKKYVPDVFESRLFICTDESELSLRCKQDGILTLYRSTLVALHKGGKSTGKVSFLATYFSARNWTLLRLRYTHGLVWWRVLLHSGYGCITNLIRARVAFPLGVACGVLLTAADAVDRLATGWVRRGRS
jgi:GT2 family glycosyltransferase